MRKLIKLISAVMLACLLLCSCGKVNGYKKKDLIPVDETPGFSNIQVFLVDYSEGKDITVKIKNLSDEVFCYGEYYSIQVFVDGAWYYVPYVNENAVHDLGHEMTAGGSDVLTYSLYPYGGKLNPGHYRIACCDGGDKKNIYYAEFNVMDNGRYTWEIVEPTGT